MDEILDPFAYFLKDRVKWQMKGPLFLNRGLKRIFFAQKVIRREDFLYEL